SRITAWQSACMCSPALLVLLLALCDHARQRFPSSQHALCNSVYTLTHTNTLTHTHARTYTHTYTHATLTPRVWLYHRQELTFSTNKQTGIINQTNKKI